MYLDSLKPSLNNIVATISNLTNMEFAIFDTSSQLVSSTPVYKERKGTNVHTASINEVLEQGNIVVNKPGNMKSCIGCRFVNNCPSSIEILSCIKVDSNPVGVISLTSFTQEGHRTIESNIRNYIEIVENTSNLISMYASNESLKKDSLILHKAFDLVIKDTNSGSLIINKYGSLIYWDKNLQSLFSYCDLYTQTIYQMFPSEIINWIYSTKRPSKKYITIQDINYTLYTRSIEQDHDSSGYLLRIEKNNNTMENIITGNYLDSIISVSSEINIIKDRILRINKSISPVLITGETGTGKEMIARAIHNNSKRSNGPFIPINCANIPENLFESELFGYDEGAFTGAKKGGKTGLFEVANGGTIFLDEIGELGIYQQAKLLRVIQEGCIQRIGSTISTPIDVRVISATNRDLDAMISEDKFRSDLYYRIGVIPINIPPLRKRIDDIPLLVDHFIRKFNSKIGNVVLGVEDDVMELFKDYPWPGNVRELENAIEYSINMELMDKICLDNLPCKIRNFRKVDQKDLFAEREAYLINELLGKNGWDYRGKEKTAEELGISVRTLYRKIKKS